jgi:septin family protein
LSKLQRHFELVGVLYRILERISKTVEIEKKYMEIEEKGVKLRLTIVDTPGFNDAVNANEWYLSMFSIFCKFSLGAIIAIINAENSFRIKKNSPTLYIRLHSCQI